MKRNGFTLAELIVSVGIVAVIGAILIPGINRILPDKDKGLVLKAYNSLVEINNDIFHNPSLYAMGTLINGTTDEYCTDILMCTSAPLDGNHPNCVGVDKYPLLVAENLSLSEDLVNDEESSVYRFSTTDNVEWTMTTIFDSASGRMKSYNIVINTLTEGKDDCLFSETCKNPRLYSFSVDEKGRVNAEDSLTKAYLLNPTNMRDRCADLEKAESLLH